MKKTLFTFAIMGSLALASCSVEVETDETTDEVEQTDEVNDEAEDESSASIVGDWALTDFDPGGEVPAEELEMFEKTKQQMIEVTRYTFNEDGSMHVKTSMLGSTIEYDQTYRVEGDQLISIEESGDEIPFTHTVSDDELVIKQDNGGTIMTMTFARQ